MAVQIQAVRGMNDILPAESYKWQWLLQQASETLAAYGYSQIMLPLVEKTQLFSRAVGEITDIVEKEMYTFTDLNGDSLTLRPEGTAGCVRACLEHGLLHNQQQKLWYFGPMFRHERPQRGRYRQFYQIGGEVFGIETADADAEMIMLLARLWRLLGVDNKLELKLNSLGTPASRQRYRQALVDYFSKHQAELDEDSKRRLNTNPMRILDSKNPAMIEINKNAPSILDYLDEESNQHFSRLQQLLEQQDIAYSIDCRLVRGLDYYQRTVFEWVTTELGAQGTVCGGGRYDGLVELLGGKSAPAVGFSIGIERILELIPTTTEPEVADIFVVTLDEGATTVAFSLAEKIRDRLPHLKILVNCGGGSGKSQLKRADKSGAKLAFILGEDEIKTKQITIKHLREQSQQQQLQIKMEEIDAYLSDFGSIE